MTNIRVFYDEIYSKEVLKEPDYYYDWILRLSKATGGEKLLDVACGGGFLLRAAEEREIDTYAIDVSRIAILLAKKNAPKSEILVGEASKLPWKDDEFDLVTCLGSLEHFFDSNVCLKEILRVLKKNGRVCFVVPNAYFIGYFWTIYREGGLHHGQLIEKYLSRKEWESLLEKNGLRILSVYKYNPKWQLRDFRYLLYRLLRPLIPINLSYHLVFICGK